MEASAATDKYTAAAATMLSWESCSRLPFALPLKGTGPEVFWLGRYDSPV